MGDGTVFTPDIGFVRSLKNSGADTMKQCYQCATCSTVCELTPSDNPFPRKEMIMAQWGLKDELAADPDIWLCHNCNDCSKYCPRGARPGDVLSVLRKAVIAENAFPRFMGTIVGNTRLLLVALMIPVVLFLCVLNASGHLNIPDGEVVFRKFFPIQLVDSIFVSTAMAVVFVFAISVGKFWRKLNVNPYKLMAHSMLLPSLLQTLKEIVLHKKFQKCGANLDRTWTHRLVLFGFIGLFITTNWAVFNLYVLKWDSPYLKDDPNILMILGSQAAVMLYYAAFKIFGNASALILFIGSLMLFSNRMKDKGVNSVSSSFDWIFATIVFLVCITGLASEMLRFANIAQLAYPVYFVHLVFVFYIIAYLPYSKLAHMVYRTTAIVYAKMANRDVM
ncbi:quinone-interacting membrane-bound oxidoreductase complex subunit QmoC [Candidatus Magnetominusculus dajiuhuensis]|uniref:quinone-interacting membrane-bound oxidoreductase complex subunit QmoC n=1 Tax=Candidatus Magnetominusculus dajiuhuensis TaxID=3137712 RepID=UPI003B42C12C